MSAPAQVDGGAWLPTAIGLRTWAPAPLSGRVQLTVSCGRPDRSSDGVTRRLLTPYTLSTVNTFLAVVPLPAASDEVTASVCVPFESVVLLKSAPNGTELVVL